jgi:hypothetical protein
MRPSIAVNYSAIEGNLRTQVNDLLASNTVNDGRAV